MKVTNINEAKTDKEHIDFMFGKVYEYEGRLSISLYDFRDSANIILTPKILKKEINRLLSSVNTDHLYAEASSSNYDLNKILTNIPLEIVNAVVFTRRDNKNTNIDYTLSLALYFDNGILELSSDWSMYKEIRAYEVFDSFLKPLILHGYIFNAGIDDRSNPMGGRRIVNASSPESIIKMILGLSGYGKYYKDNEKFMNEVIGRVEDALTVAHNEKIKVEDKDLAWRDLQNERHFGTPE